MNIERKRNWRGFFPLLVFFIFTPIFSHAATGGTFTPAAGNQGEAQYNKRGTFAGTPYVVIDTTTQRMKVFVPPMASTASYASYCSAPSHVGRLLISSGSTSGQWVYVCESSGNWVQQGGSSGGSGGGYAMEPSTVTLQPAKGLKSSTETITSLSPGVMHILATSSNVAVGLVSLSTETAGPYISSVNVTSALTVTANGASGSAPQVAVNFSSVASQSDLANYVATTSSGSFIQNRNTLQPGSTAYLSSATVNGQMSIVAPTAGSIPLTLVEAPAQSGNMLNLRNSAGTILIHLDSNGDWTFDHTNGHLFWASNALSIYHDGGNGSVQNTIGGFNFNNTAATGAMSFGTNNVTRMYIKSTGEIGIPTVTPGAQLEVDVGSNTAIGQIVKGAASQTGDLFEFQLSSGVTVASVTAKGGIVASTITASTAFVFGDGSSMTTAPSASVTAASSTTFSGLNTFNNSTTFVSSATFSGILVSTGASAAINSCGPAASMRGGFTAGVITVPVAVVTACVIDFPSPTKWKLAPSCFINDRNTTAFAPTATTTTTQLTINASASMSASTLDYFCIEVP